MSEGGAPAGVNSAMLESMRQANSNANAGASAGIGGGNEGLGGIVGGGKNTVDELFTESKISLGEFGSVDSLAAGLGGAFGQNPFKAVEGNMSPLGISREGLKDINGLGDTSLSNATSFTSNLNIKGVPTLISQGQSQ